ncbi:MAG TPA: hypothetical protein VFW66_14400 [Gemmatimonadales bacterium]|nr:hypothetical protein [Gemmatimonadales bacterium]
MSATVVSAEPERFRLADGRVLFARPGQPAFPAEVVPAEPVTRLALRTSGARKELRLGYFTSGAAWEASYEVVLGRAGAQTMARVTGAAVITSQTLAADSAEVQLLAGAVSRAQAPQPPPRPVARAEAFAAKAPSAEAAEQRVGEFHLYTLAGRTTLVPGTTTSVALFAPASAAVDRAYVVPGELPYWGFVPQQGDETEVPVQVSYTVKRPRKTAFGEKPLPAGVARLFQPDSAGRVQLIGEAAVDHTPAGEDLKLDAGTAFDLTARRVQTSYSTRRDSTAAHGIRTVVTADYRVSLTNATDSAATVEVREQRTGEWSVLSSSVPAERVSSTLVKFRVPVPARGSATLTYRIRAAW